jgi:hypothetical protein
MLMCACTGVYTRGLKRGEKQNRSAFGRRLARAGKPFAGRARQAFVGNPPERRRATEEGVPLNGMDSLMLKHELQRAGYAGGKRTIRRTPRESGLASPFLASSFLASSFLAVPRPS